LFTIKNVFKINDKGREGMGERRGRLGRRGCLQTGLFGFSIIAIIRAIKSSMSFLFSPLSLRNIPCSSKIWVLSKKKETVGGWEGTKSKRERESERIEE